MQLSDQCFLGSAIVMRTCPRFEFICMRGTCMIDAWQQSNLVGHLHLKMAFRAKRGARHYWQQFHSPMAVPHCSLNVEHSCSYFLHARWLILQRSMQDGDGQGHHPPLHPPEVFMPAMQAYDACCLMQRGNAQLTSILQSSKYSFKTCNLSNDHDLPRLSKHF